MNEIGAVITVVDFHPRVLGLLPTKLCCRFVIIQLTQKACHSA